MSQATVYLVTGPNRGIGLGLVAHILEKHSYAFVYAGVRDPQNVTALRNLQNLHPGRMEIVKCMSADLEGNVLFAREIQIENRHGHLDTVISNAGIYNSNANVADISVAAMEEHFHVNVMGTIVLFQAVYELLKKSASPRFVTISSSGGSLDGRAIKFPVGGVSYGATKAALNWVTRKMHFENEWLVTFPISPGPVDTDMLRTHVIEDKTGELQKWINSEILNVPTVETVSVSLINLIDDSTREKDGGQFLNVDGTRIPW